MHEILWGSTLLRICNFSSQVFEKYSPYCYICCQGLGKSHVHRISNRVRRLVHLIFMSGWALIDEILKCMYIRRFGGSSNPYRYVMHLYIYDMHHLRTVGQCQSGVCLHASRHDPFFIRIRTKHMTHLYGIGKDKNPSFTNPRHRHEMRDDDRTRSPRLYVSRSWQLYGLCGHMETYDCL